MMEEPLKTLGFKQMHQMQIDALLDLINKAINVACITGDEDIIEEVERCADDLIHLFGGNGVTIKVDVNG
jgi:hypothetical protein|tara:strand:- start:207 stop:416 length:210 start_codon:yes stop_codon:yes gene_type:complete